MEIRNTRILILGGSGLVGRTIARALLRENPKAIIIHSKTKEETKLALKELREVAGPAAFYKTKLSGEWGDIFDADFLSPLSSKILKNSYLYKLIYKYQPDIIVDSVNSATAIAYQNLFEKSLLVREKLTAKNVRDLLAALYIPKLVRHIQVLYEAMKLSTSKGGQEGITASVDTFDQLSINPELVERVEGEPRSNDRGGLLERAVVTSNRKQNGVKLYLKIGTTGTGGMGFNIPFTHGEEKPSRMLLSKSALAGAQSQLLYLLSQTPGGPRIIELKPATSIAWGKLGLGHIKNLFLTDSKRILKLKAGRNLNIGRGEKLNQKLSSLFVDSGENGLFSPEEFRALSDPAQMGFMTPEEIADLAVREIKGESTGKDVVKSLEKSVLGPSKLAAGKRGEAFATLKALAGKESESPALGFLGPPRLSKLLFEGRLIKETFGSFKKFLEASASEDASSSDEVAPLRAKGGADSGSQRSQSQIALKAEKEILSNGILRKFALTAGIPILLPNGKGLICAQRRKVPESGENQKVTPKNINSWAERGWIDLRQSNFKLWRRRIAQFILSKGRPPRFEGEVAAFIFKTEDGGFRKKQSSL